MSKPTDNTADADGPASEARELDDDPEDGRLFGDQRRHRDEQKGSVDTSLIPDDATDLQATILEYSLLNPNASKTELHEKIIEQEFDGDEDAAPAYSTIWRTLDMYDGIELRDGREDNGRVSETNESDSDEPDFSVFDPEQDGDYDPAEDADTIETENGTGSYSGPAEGIDATEQYITERPATQDASEQASADTGGDDDASMSEALEDARMDAEASAVRFSEDEILRLLARLDDRDVDLIERLASHV